MLYRVRFRPIWFVFLFLSSFLYNFNWEPVRCLFFCWLFCLLFFTASTVDATSSCNCLKKAVEDLGTFDRLSLIYTTGKRFKWKKRKRLAIMKRGNAIFFGQSHLTIETVPSFSAFCRSCNSRALACLLPSPGLTLSTAFSLRSRSLCRTRWAVFLARRSRNRSVFSFSVEPLRAPLTGSV